MHEWQRVREPLKPTCPFGCSVLVLNVVLLGSEIIHMAGGICRSDCKKLYVMIPFPKRKIQEKP